MPNSFLPPIDQSIASAFENVILVGDAYNMRHPLTGGGMTVAFNDVVLLRDLLQPLSRNQALADQKGVKDVLNTWFTKRKHLATSVNILSVALYDLFGANGPELSILREGCFKYFELGGSCITGPVGLLSGSAFYLSLSGDDLTLEQNNSVTNSPLQALFHGCVLFNMGYVCASPKPGWPTQEGTAQCSNVPCIDDQGL